MFFHYQIYCRIKGFDNGDDAMFRRKFNYNRNTTASTNARNERRFPKFEAFDGKTIRNASDLKVYLRRKGFGTVSLDANLERNEIAYFSDECTLVYNGLDDEILLEYYEPTTADEIIADVEEQIGNDDDLSEDDIDDLCRDSCGILSSEYTACFTLSLPVRIQELEESAEDIDARAEKLNREAMAKASRYLIDKYVL